MWLNLQRIVDKQGRTGEKGARWHPPGGGVTPEFRVKWIKATVMSKKGRQFFSGKNRGDTVSRRPRVTPTLVTPLTPPKCRYAPNTIFHNGGCWWHISGSSCGLRCDLLRRPLSEWHYVLGPNWCALNELGDYVSVKRK